MTDSPDPNDPPFAAGETVLFKYWGRTRRARVDSVWIAGTYRLQWELALTVPTGGGALHYVCVVPARVERDPDQSPWTGL